MRRKLITVVEASAYLAMAAGVLDEAERMAIVDRIAVDPRAGVLIKDTGGLRNPPLDARQRKAANKLTDAIREQYRSPRDEKERF